MEEKNEIIVNINQNSLYKTLGLASLIIIVFLAFSIGSNGPSINANAIQTTQGSQDASVEKAVLIDGKQEITMNVDYSGWSPKVFALKKGVPTKWIINGEELTGCNNGIIIKDYNINFEIKQGENIIEFTPDKDGLVSFTCRMGMLKGTFIVTDTGDYTQEQLDTISQQKQGGTCSMGGCGCGGSR